MALIFCDGFDHYSDPLTKWDSWYYPFDTVYSTISSSYGRFSTSGWALASSFTFLQKSIPSGPQSALAAGVAFNPVNGVVNAPCILLQFICDDGSMVGVAISETHQIYAFTGSYWSVNAGHGEIGDILGYGTKPARTGVYQYIELRVSSFNETTGAVQVYLSDDLIINLSNVNTSGMGTDKASAVRIGGYATWVRADYAGPIYFDDFYLTDATDESGAGNTGRLGDVRINELMPNADGNYLEWDSTGSSHCTEVDDNPPDSDLTYVSTTTVGARDTYTFPSVAPTYGNVKAVCVNFTAKKTDSGGGQIRAIGRLGSTDALGTTFTLGADYAVFQSFMEKDPDGNTWSIANVNLSEFGPKLVE